MRLHGGLADIEFVGDLLVEQALADHAKHAQLLGRQRREPFREILLLRRAALVRGLWRERCGNEDLAVHHAANGVGQFGLFRGFRHETADPAIHGLGNNTWILEAGDDDDRKAGKAGAHPQHAFEALDRGHGEIDQRQIEILPALDMRHRFLDRGGFDDLRVRIGRAHGALERLAEERMIVDDEETVHRVAPRRTK